MGYEDDEPAVTYVGTVNLDGDQLEIESSICAAVVRAADMFRESGVDLQVVANGVLSATVSIGLHLASEGGTQRIDDTYVDAFVESLRQQMIPVVENLNAEMAQSKPN